MKNPSARLRLLLRGRIAFGGLGLVLPFLLLFLSQQFLLIRVFLLQLLRLFLMLLLDSLFVGGIRLLLRNFRVFLVLLLLDSLPVLLLFCTKLILLLLVLSVEIGIRSGWKNEAWRSRNIVWMDCRRLRRAIGLGRWNTLLLGSVQPGFFGDGLELRRLLPSFVVSGPWSGFLLDSFRGGLLLRRLLPSLVVSGPLSSFLLGLVYRSLLLLRS
jgi:hypothetical protein